MEEWTRERIENAQAEEISYLYLFTPLCGTCQVAGKMLSVITALTPDMHIGKADLNYMPDIAEKWGVESVPCLLIFKKGNLEEKLYAFHSVPYLLDKIKSYG
ncbi:thioredoxin-like negative regulator of GroEL [Cytobacillus eiseniae]|uniref:Thioredoxin-like negative regulator of GroEL n=1 Tax=Cytobacillus eiseniae TaxID=762947 RepID=A0ABS4RBY3_9BACI|nr:thioredoxin-like negative regulator of GroEL [Cytobacillus eiseniae]